MNEKKTNGLINSKSPYLLQHAYNPVDWHEWGDDAFRAASMEDKPIFLSIGYSTCHWCHVMEQQSFENQEIATLMNKSFINIKVDREERPDIDSIYMECCQMLTGSGGWPLTIIMTPDKKPFFAGTYFPPKSVMGRLGMIDLIDRISDIWSKKRELVLSSANDIVAKLNEQISIADEGIKLNNSVIKAAANTLSSNFDPKSGGFSLAPKFPIPHNITFLLHYGYLLNSIEILNMAYTTLDQMRLGGIYDHIGFGFHRYSTDDKWLLPHFEKMLYDQAGLLIAYTEAYRLSGNKNYEKTAEEIIEYVKRELLSNEGAFLSAEDADSDGEEGRFYVWTISELDMILGDDSKKFADLFNMKEDGNYYDEAGEYNSSKNIPHLADIQYLNDKEKKFIEESKNKLFEYREQRVHPFKDDKILSDWNGFMIGALSYAGFVFNNLEYLTIAKHAADFLLEKMIYDEGNGLYHRYRQGEAAISAMLDDYAFMVYGLMELYFATSIKKYLDWSIEFTNIVIENFNDNESGGFYQTSKDAEILFKRHKDIYDGALPSGNSIMLYNLVRLFKITNNEKYQRAIEGTLKHFASKIMQYPAGYTKFIDSLLFIYHGSSEIVIAGNPDDSNYTDLLNVLRTNYMPLSVIIYLDNERRIEQHSKWTHYISLQPGTTNVYFCKNYSCSKPTSIPAELDRLIKQL